MEVKRFSLEEAERLLPTLGPQLTELQEAIGAMREAEAQVSVLLHQHKETGIDRADNPDRARYWELLQRARACEDRAQGLLDDVRFLGAEVKDVDLGLVDFRHERDGEVVYLCWRLGEARIGYWHSLKEGFAGRRPIEELTHPKRQG